MPILEEGIFPTAVILGGLSANSRIGEKPSPDYSDSMGGISQILELPKCLSLETVNWGLGILSLSI